MTKTIHLTESELKELIEDTLSETLNEIEGRTYKAFRTAATQAKNDHINGIPSSNPRKSNVDKIQQAVRLDPDAADSLISPYKKRYLFFGTNLRGVPSIVTFELEQLYKLDSRKTILRGAVTYNYTKLRGSLIVDLTTNNVYYNEKGKGPRYYLDIDPAHKPMWESLLEQLRKAL